MSSPGSGVVNGGISYWYADDGLPATVREPLAGDTSADVVIVGGGYTGLWTAYYSRRPRPSCGSPSWSRGSAATGLRPQRRLALQRRGGPRPVREPPRPRGGRAPPAGDERHRRRGDPRRRGRGHRRRHPPGRRARSGVHAGTGARLKAFHEAELAFGEKDRELYGARETAERIRVAGAIGSTWTPHGARLHPVKLVKGLGRPSNASACASTSRRRSRRSAPAARSPRTAPSARPTSCAAPRGSPPPSRASGAPGFP